MEPGMADRLADWLRQNTTNSSITGPNAEASQVPCPESAKQIGMISTAVMVGEMRATDWARRVGNPRARVLNPWIEPPADGGLPVATFVASIVLIPHSSAIGSMDTATSNSYE